jgi:hypothetical protein
LSATQFAVPVEDRYFEDYLPGTVFEYGEIPVTEAEIIEFARRFDPNTSMSTPMPRPEARLAGLSPAAGIPRL